MKDYSILKRILTEKFKIIRQGKFEKLQPEFQVIYKSTLNSEHKDEILSVGTNLLIYLMDVIRKDPVEGAKLIGYLSLGYPDKKGTDLYFSIYECINLQRLYIKSSKDFGFEDEKTQSLIINVYFRWYSTVYETYRKLLTFCLYCNKIKTGQDFANINEYIFGIANPAKGLKSESPKSQYEAVLKYYNGEIRHSISHANICLISGEKNPNLYSILLRETSNDQNKITERYFENIVDFAHQTEKDITIMFQSMRLFIGVTSSYITDCFGDTFNDIVGHDFKLSEYHKRMIKKGALY